MNPKTLTATRLPHAPGLTELRDDELDAIQGGARTLEWTCGTMLPGYGLPKPTDPPADVVAIFGQPKPRPY